MAYPNAIILGQSFKQLNSLAKHPFPAVSAGIFERSVFVFAPFVEQSHGAVRLGKESGKGLLKAAAEEQSWPTVFLPPAIQIAMSIASGAAQILGHLGVAVGHRSCTCVLVAEAENSSQS